MRPADGGGAGGFDAADGLAAGVVVVVGGGTLAAASGSSNVGPILTFVGAILVALITAYTTNRRQRAQLAADARRLETQLAHERSLRDLDNLRAFLEDGNEAWEEAVESLLRLREARRSSDRTEVETLRNAAKAAIRRTDVVARRFALRLPEDHPTYRAYRTAWSQLTKTADILCDGEWPLAPEGQRKLADAQSKVNNAWKAFHGAAVTTVGTKIAEPARAGDGQERTRGASPPESTGDGGA